jgi:hypothetical protein
MKQLILRCTLLAAFAAACALPASAGELTLTMRDGRVTIIATNVPLRQILQEWARVGQTQIVNADKLANQTVTLQLVNASEREALDVLLRSANGYIAAPRPVALTGAAAFDRVTIFVATKTAPAQAAVAAPPTFQRPPMIEDVDDVPVNVQMPPQMNPNGQQFPGLPQGMPPALQQQLQQNQQMLLQQPNQGLQAPGNSPLTSPRPGALPQPGIPGAIPNPYQPQVIRPGGPGGPGGPGIVEKDNKLL